MIKIYLFTAPILKEKKIAIECNLNENSLPSNMPERKWNKRKKRWEASVARLNMEYLRRNRHLYEASDEFWDLLNHYHLLDKTEGSFPKEYPFKTEPMPHQLACCKKLYPFRHQAIFADIGTGKTKMSIDMASCRYYEGKISKVLVIGLVSIKDNWAAEVFMHCPINPTVHVLNTSVAGQKRYNAFLEEDGFRWLITGIESYSQGKTFDMVSKFVDDDTMIIIDESDSIKTDGKIRTERCISLGKFVKYKTIMTGTPIEQGLINLYSQFEFLDKDIIGIGSFYAFKNRYAVMGGYNDKIVVAYQRTDELLNATSRYVYQVRKRDVLKDLPESTYQERSIKMSTEQRKLYNELKKKLKMEYEGNKLSVKSAINLIQRLSEITGGFYSYVDDDVMSEIPDSEKAKIKYKKRYLKTNPKLNELMNFISSLPTDEPVIIWAVSKMEVRKIVEEVSNKYGPDSVSQLHGDIDREQRTEELAKFQCGETRFLIGVQSVGGIGLNMTRACIMVYFSNDFSLRRRIQSEGRIERIGQKRPMVYVDLICAGSVDRYIVNALKSKNDFSEEIRRSFDSGELEVVI